MSNSPRELAVFWLSSHCIPVPGPPAKTLAQLCNISNVTMLVLINNSRRRRLYCHCIFKQQNLFSAVIKAHFCEWGNPQRKGQGWWGIQNWSFLLWHNSANQCATMTPKLHGAALSSVAIVMQVSNLCLPIPFHATTINLPAAIKTLSLTLDKVNEPS